MLAHFSTSHAYVAVEAALPGIPVLTTPAAAAYVLRSRIDG